MIVQLGYTRSNNKKIDKDFTIVRELTCNIRGVISLLRPRLIINYYSTMVECNYMRVPEWGRYYFIDTINMIPGQRMEVVGSVDVLMSYAEQIRNLQVYAARAETMESPYFADGLQEAEVASNITVHNIATPFFTEDFSDSSYCYLFTVLGGADNQAPTP